MAPKLAKMAMKATSRPMKAMKATVKPTKAMKKAGGDAEWRALVHKKPDPPQVIKQKNILRKSRKQMNKVSR